MPLVCGSNVLTKTVKHTLEALDARTACMFAMEFAEKVADREIGAFIRQICPDNCSKKSIVRNRRTVTNVVGRWVHSGGYTVYRATAWVEFTVEITCTVPPPPPPPPPPAPLIGVGAGGSSSGLGDADVVEPDEEQPPAPPVPCNAPCSCLGPRCPLPTPHVHCGGRATECAPDDPLGSLENAMTGCHMHGGVCVLPSNHQGEHFCRHGHPIRQ